MNRVQMEVRVMGTGPLAPMAAASILADRLNGHGAGQVQQDLHMDYLAIRAAQSHVRLLNLRARRVVGGDLRCGNDPVVTVDCEVHVEQASTAINQVRMLLTGPRPMGTGHAPDPTVDVLDVTVTPLVRKAR